MQKFTVVLFLASLLLIGCINVRDALSPVASIENVTQDYTISNSLGKPVSTQYIEDFQFNASHYVDKFEAKPLVASSRFKSKFFQGDETAEKIFSGEIMNYSVAEFKPVTPNNRNTFAFKILNAMRMLEYNPGCGMGYAECYAHFLSLNNLTQNEIVTRESLIAIDELIAEQEQRDNLDSRKFSNYDDFIELNRDGEPSKNHLVALFQRTFGLLPLHLLANKEGMRVFFYYQLSDGASGNESIKCNINKQCEVAFSTYYSSLTFDNDSSNIFLINDDYTQMATALHEYGHYLDQNFYQRNNELGAGIINTTEFYAFSFNLSTAKTLPVGWTYYKYNAGVEENLQTHFVSEYSKGWTPDGYPTYHTAYEDFAESFSMYVLAGNVFRCKANSYPIIQQKYEWLKNNVFNGIEYAYAAPFNCTAFYLTKQKTHAFRHGMNAALLKPYTSPIKTRVPVKPRPLGLGKARVGEV